MKLLSKYSKFQPIRDHDTSTSRTDRQTDRRLTVAILRSAQHRAVTSRKNVCQELRNTARIFGVVVRYFGILKIIDGNTAFR